MLTSLQIPEGTTVELVLNLKKGDVPLHYLSCPGKVIRTETATYRGRVALAIACDHPFSEHS